MIWILSERITLLENNYFLSLHGLKAKSLYFLKEYLIENTFWKNIIAVYVDELNISGTPEEL